MSISLAFRAFFRLLSDQDYAGRVAALDKPADKPAAPAPGPAVDEGALRLLRLLQKEGRLLDFLEEDLSAYEDAQIGASVRAVHEGCRSALAKALKKERILAEEEGASFRVDAGYDAAALKLTGGVGDRYPMKGTVVHPGWKAVSLELPPAPAGAATVLAPAEVEVG